jgi:ubiquinone/menaquinone biosynthesis C-methylase UbiE
MSSDESTPYVLQGGDRGAERLRLLAEVTWPTTRPLLERAGLRAGLRCLDVGCGIGAVTLRMAELVGPTGTTTGIDFDERSLEIARGEASRLGLAAEFRRADAGDLKVLDTYDLVFARFLLTHLAEPERALAKMVGAVRPGGILVVEDIQFSGHFCWPACPAFDRFVALYQQIVRRKGGDPEIGPRLLELAFDAGLQDVELDVIQPTYRSGPGKRMASVTLEHIRDAVVAAGLSTPREMEGWIAELDAFAEDPTTMMSLPRIFQVWGRAPG